MANNYLQFSEMIVDLTEEEANWWKNFHELTAEDLGVGDNLMEQFEWGADFVVRETDLWIYAEEGGSPDAVGAAVYAFMRKFRPDDVFSLTWAETCSKMRPSNFSGGVLRVDKDGWACVCADSLAALTTTELKEIVVRCFKDAPEAARE